MLTFEPVKHEYRFDGKVVPSVTQVLSPLSDFSFVDPDVLQAACDFGTAVHLACELYDKGELDTEQLDPELAPYLAGWVKFCADYECCWTRIEERLFNSSMRYAGTLDRRGSVKGYPAIVDIKTCAKLYASTGPQLSAYAHTFAHGVLMRRYAVRLFPNGYELKEYTDPNDWPVFASLLTLRTFCATHQITPRFYKEYSNV